MDPEVLADRGEEFCKYSWKGESSFNKLSAKSTNIHILK
jgi:hypothetical protein